MRNLSILLAAVALLVMSALPALAAPPHDPGQACDRTSEGQPGAPGNPPFCEDDDTPEPDEPEQPNDPSEDDDEPGEPDDDADPTPPHECPTDETPCHDEHPEIELPRDCASGPDHDSEEWERATEWREWWHANCLDHDVEIGKGTNAEVIESEEPVTPKGEEPHDDERTSGHVASDMPTGEEVVSASVEDTLPETGTGLALLALLGAALATGGGLLLRNKRFA